MMALSSQSPAMCIVALKLRWDFLWIPNANAKQARSLHSPYNDVSTTVPTKLHVLAPKRSSLQVMCLCIHVNFHVLIKSLFPAPDVRFGHIGRSYIRISLLVAMMSHESVNHRLPVAFDLFESSGTHHPRLHHCGYPKQSEQSTQSV